MCNARVEVNGQTISFLPDTSRDEYGNITVVFGQYFENVILILKRVDFGAVCEQEQLTIEVRIRRLMGETMATAGKVGYNANKNIQKWQDLGEEAEATGQEKYRYANVKEWSGDIQLDNVVTEPFLSLRSLSFTRIQSEVTEWRSDLPALEDANCLYISGPLEVFDAKMPNLKEAYNMFQNKQNLRSFSSEMPSLTDARGMFYGCTGLTSWNVELPSLINASYMFQNCSKLDSWTVALPNSITDASAMFQGCTSLTSFQSDMPASLTREAQGMFNGCKLDIESVERISRTIAYCTGTYDYDKTIHLGVSSECHGDTNYDTYINRMIEKGWVVGCDVNGSEHTHQHS